MSAKDDPEFLDSLDDVAFVTVSPNLVICRLYPMKESPMRLMTEYPDRFGHSSLQRLFGVCVFRVG